MILKKIFPAVLAICLLAIQAPVSAEKVVISPLAKLDLSELARKRNYWPTKGWRTKKPKDVGFDPVKLSLAEAYTFQKVGSEDERKGVRSDSLVIIKNGYLVYERYARNFSKETPHLLWSVSKSVVNAFYGIAVLEGKLKINDPAHKYFFALNKDGEYKEITIHHLLQMSSGLYWKEGYEASPLNSSVIAMLYTFGREDMAAFAASQHMLHKPGTKWYYSSGSSNLLMAILKSVYKDNYADFPWTSLFDKLGMKKVIFEKDKSGTYVGSSYIYMRPVDLAKFGFLYLNDGIWESKRLLPEGWVQYSTTMSDGYLNTTLGRVDEKDNYAAHWYINTGIPHKKVERPWPDAPKDTFHASGHWGQYLFVIPSLDMVIVRTGDDRDGSFNKALFLKLILRSLKGYNPDKK